MSELVPFPARVTLLSCVREMIEHAVAAYVKVYLGPDIFKDILAELDEPPSRISVRLNEIAMQVDAGIAPRAIVVTLGQFQVIRFDEFSLVPDPGPEAAKAADVPPVAN